jgi:hypothetical protein
MRAYVTSSDDAQTSAMRARYGLAPRHVASSWLVAHERLSPRAARTACWRRSRGMAQGDGGRRLRSYAGAAAAKVATLRAAGNAMVPVVLTGRCECEHRSRARTPRRSHHPEVAPDAPILRQAQNRYAASDALASMTKATRQRCSASLEEPGARVNHETPGHPSRDVF